MVERCAGRAARSARTRVDHRQHLLERNPPEHDLGNGDHGIEQDQRDSVGSDGGARHPAVAGCGSRASAGTAQSRRARHQGALDAVRARECDARESDQHGPLPRDRAGVARPRAGRDRDDPDAHGRHRPSVLSKVRHCDVRVRSVPGGEQRRPARVHGNDERVSLANIRDGVHYLYDVLRYAQ